MVDAAAGSSALPAGQPGCVARELVVSAGGEWLDVIRWMDLEAAPRAAEGVATAPEARQFLDLLERGSVEVRHVRSVYRYAAPRPSEGCP